MILSRFGRKQNTHTQNERKDAKVREKKRDKPGIGSIKILVYESVSHNKKNGHIFRQNRIKEREGERGRGINL